jgi:hypothetical protein
MTWAAAAPPRHDQFQGQLRVSIHVHPVPALRHLAQADRTG